MKTYSRYTVFGNFRRRHKRVKKNMRIYLLLNFLICLSRRIMWPFNASILLLLQVGKCKFILYFHCTNECMTERLLGRAKTSGRVDDNIDTIKLRLKTFENQTLPILDKYADRIKKVHRFSFLFDFKISWGL